MEEQKFVIIQLPEGDVFLDESDCLFVTEFGIRIKIDVDNYKAVYLCGKLSGKILARVLLNATSNIEIDHKNGNPLDNRRHNLRLATRAQNAFNLTKRKDKKNQTLPKGVYQRAPFIFRSKLTVHGMIFYFGPFRTAEEAKAAREEKAKLFFGEFYRP